MKTRSSRLEAGLEAPRSSPDRRRRGSVLILVAAVLVLLVLIGTAYIQAARLDRLATAKMNDNYIDQVLAATLSRISGELYDDVAYEDGDAIEYLSPAQHDEPFDYPWTNHAGTPGENDDMWLASGSPTDNSGVESTLSMTRWPHITNLTGDAGFLEEDGSGNNGNDENFALQTIGAGGGYTVDVTNQDLSVDDRADADGDGLTDSRWAVAPLAEIRGIRYVMSVRIIDTSAMVNVDTLMGQTDSSGTTYGDPRWWYPSELDLGRWMIDDQGASSGEVQALLEERFGDLLVGGLPPAWAGGRREYWQDGVATGFTVGNYVSMDRNVNEGELRYRNGLNDDQAEAPLETLMSTFTRTTATENEWSDVAGVATFSDFFLNEPRKWMTVHSNTGTYAPWRVDRGSGDYIDRLIHLPTLLSSDDTARDESRDLLYDAARLTAFSQGAVTPYGGAANVAAGQYTANAVDYFDGGSDSRIARYEADGGIYYGMESLPFLTEVYLHGCYRLTSVTEKLPANPGMFDLTWTITGNLGYAIEMVSPFEGETANLQDVRVVVNGSPWGTLDTLSGATSQDGRTGIVLYRKSGGVSTNNWNDPRPWGDGSYTKPTDWVENEIDKTINADTDIVVELQVRVEPDDGSAGGDEWITYCRIQRTPGQFPGEPDKQLRLPGQKTESNVSIPQPADQPQENQSDYDRYNRRAAYCDAVALNPVAVICQTGDTQMNEMAGAGTTATGWATQETPGGPIKQAWAPNKRADDSDWPVVGQIGKEDKDQAAWVEPWASDANAAQRAYRFSDGDEVRFAGELLNVMWVGPTDSATYAEVFRLAGAALGHPTPNPATGVDDPLRRRMPDAHSATARQPANLFGNEDQAVPCAAMLLDLATTLRPMVNGEDDDGDGEVDEDDELFIPGRINLNTVPTYLLAQVLPLGDKALRDSIAGYVHDYRRIDGTHYTSGNRTRGDRVGIASLGELLQLPALVIHKWAGDIGFTAADGGVQVAYDAEGNALSDGPIDDRAEAMRLLSFLAQTCSTRSDTFAAYIQVRGYRADGEHTYQSDHLEEQKKAIAIFDRSGITEDGGQVELVGLHVWGE